MKFTSKKKIEFEVLYKSLIGYELRIVDSKNKIQVGIKGILVNETASFFVLNVNNNVTRILKRNIVFEIDSNGLVLELNGELFVGTLTQRLKKIK